MNRVALSYETLDWQCRLLADQISVYGVTFDCMVAVTGEGLFVGHLLSQLLGIHEVWTIGIDKKDPQRPLINMPNPMIFSDRNVLLVDFLSETGVTFSQMKRLLNLRGYQGTKLISAAIFWVPQDETSVAPDIYVEDLENENITYVFPWS